MVAPLSNMCASRACDAKTIRRSRNELALPGHRRGQQPEPGTLRGYSDENLYAQALFS